MADRFFMLLVDGVAEFHILGASSGAEDEDAPAIPEGAVEVPRLPAAGESWDPALGDFVLDPEVRARLEEDRSATLRAHAVKEAQASFVASGYSLKSGLLYEEAKATGVPIATLAAAVLANAAAANAAEVARRVAIAEARSEKGSSK